MAPPGAPGSGRSPDCFRRDCPAGRVPAPGLLGDSDQRDRPDHRSYGHRRRGRGAVFEETA